MTRAAVVGLVVCFAGVARAQEPAPPAEDEGPPAYAPPAPEVPQPSPARPGEAVPGQPPPPAAEIAAAFGAAGQITISDDLQLTATRFSVEGQSAKVTNIQLAPAVDFFPVANLSVGGQLTIGYITVDDSPNSGNQSTLRLGVGGRVGYDVAFSPTASIWPRVGLAYFHGSGSIGGSASHTSYTVQLDVHVPIIFQPAPHFFLGGGPFLQTELVSKSDGADVLKQTAMGLQATLGGYFRGL